MSAMKRLNYEYRKSGWNLSGLPLKERPTWRRLLPTRLDPKVSDNEDPVEQNWRREQQAMLYLAGQTTVDPTLTPPWED